MPTATADDLIELLEERLLPEEIQQELNQRMELRAARVERIVGAVLDKRKEAVEFRKNSGIEDEWQSAEDQYSGIDDANRNDTRWIKPANPEGVLTTSPLAMPARSTAFLNITRPYTDAAASRISDMLLPTDDRNWALKPTPIPELTKRLKDMTPVPGMMTDKPMPLPPGQEPAPPPMGAEPAAPEGPRPMVMADAAQALLDKANEQAKAAEKRIDDWLTQCCYQGEIRRVILDCAKLGTGALKGPVPTRRKAKKVTIDSASHEVMVDFVSSIDPMSKAISVWDLYPDPSGRGDIHAGSYILEKDALSGRRVRELKDEPGYIPERIDQVLLEGPGKKYLADDYKSSTNSKPAEDETYEIWYFYGELDKSDYEVLRSPAGDLKSLLQGEEAHCSDSTPVLVTLINDVAVKVTRNPLDSGEFPYDLVPWQERADSPWGSGVPYQIRIPQQIANAGVRNMMDNAGLAGGPILAIDQGMLTPADGSWDICPRKVFLTTEDAIGKDVRTAIMSISIPMMQVELLGIIQFALKMAEDVTGLPMLLQGQLGKAPDTVGGMQMLQNNASSVVRRLAKVFDDDITEPHIGRYYEWLLLYGPEASEKGDFFIDARGSSALVERDIQNQTIANMLALSANPVFGLSPARCMEEFLKSQRLDPSRFKPTDAEKQAAAQQPQQPPPQVLAAQIREEGALQRAQMQAQVGVAKIKADTDRDTTYVQAETQRTQAEHDARMQELALKLQLAQLDYANKNEVTLAQIKADLAQTSAKLNLQRELAQTPPAGAPQVTKPPTEPAGRAPKGLAFQR